MEPQAEERLPRLRPDLDVAPQREGERNWFVLHNPSTGRYHRLSPAALAVLRRLDGRTPIAALDADVGGQQGGARARAIREVIARAEQAGLLEISGAAAPAARRRQVAAHGEPGPRSVGRALLFRVCAFDPARLLAIIEPWLRPLFSRWGAALLAAGIIAASALILTRAAQFFASLKALGYFDNWVLGYACVSVATLVHEAGHAVACRRYGGPVREAGVMLYLFMPMAYTDVSASWMFADRRHRIVVALGGVYCEAFLWCAAVLAWYWTAPYGKANQVAFVVSLLLLLRMLANLVPLLRLDGYWVLADCVSIPNLRPKALYRLLTLLGRRWRWSRPPTAAESRVLLVYGVAAAASVAAALIGMAFGLRHLLMDVPFGQAAFWVAVAAGLTACAVSVVRGAAALRANFGVAAADLEAG
jgi:putative peptide zinc metalloprotease protein